MVLAPPDPVTINVRHKFIQGGSVRFVIDGQPNSSIAVPALCGHWLVEAKATDGAEWSVSLGSVEFDANDPGDFPWTPTNQDIGGPTLTAEYDT